MGHLTVLMGCMFAQKTTELLRRIRRFKAIGYKVLVVNYVGDTRYGTNRIASHDVDTCDAICVNSLSEVASQVANYNALIIDEGQFYPDLYKYVTEWADRLPLKIIVAGLSGDSERKPFGDMLNLVPMAEETEHLTAYCSVCKDGTVAMFSKCIKAKTGQVSIGSSDTYIPVCRQHYLSS
jgi:thymidine kinase